MIDKAFILTLKELRLVSGHVRGVPRLSALTHLEELTYLDQGNKLLPGSRRQFSTYL